MAANTHEEEYRNIAAKDFPQFSPKDVDNFIAQFQAFDDNGDGHIDADELSKIMKGCDMNVTPAELNKLIKEVDANDNGTIEWGEFLTMINKIVTGEASAESGFGNVVRKAAKMLVVEGSSAGTQHSFSEEERDAFVDHINQCLSGHEKLKTISFPIGKTGMELFDAVKDGTLLCALINDSVADTIDERVVNWTPKNAYTVVENQNLVINSARAIGCSVVNIGHGDLTEGKVHIVLGLVWQIVRIGLLAKISLSSCPELFRLLEDGETLDDLMKLSPEELLKRWVNYHLKAAGHARRITNFSGDVKDSEIYTVLLHQIKPAECSMAPMSKDDPKERAECMLEQADAIGCRKYVSPKDVVRGNAKLNLAFVANLFNTWPSLEPLTEEEKAALDDWLFNSTGTREARTFCLWINSLGVEPFVNDLFSDLRDGLIILRVMDIIEPGVVDWAKVNKGSKLNPWKKAENCNYAVTLGKGMGFSLVGVGGKDIVDGNVTLTLSIVWQLMRLHVLTILKSLSTDGKRPSDEEILSWANNTMQAKGKGSHIKSFNDKCISNSQPLLDLLDSIKSCIDYSLCNLADGASEDDKLLNARYAISVARKLGSAVFLLPEDIVEVKPKMVFTFVASVMAASKQLSA